MENVREQEEKPSKRKSAPKEKRGRSGSLEQPSAEGDVNAL